MRERATDEIKRAFDMAILLSVSLRRSEIEKEKKRRTDVKKFARKNSARLIFSISIDPPHSTAKNPLFGVFTQLFPSYLDKKYHGTTFD